MIQILQMRLSLYNFQEKETRFSTSHVFMDHLFTMVAQLNHHDLKKNHQTRNHGMLFVRRHFFIFLSFSFQQSILRARNKQQDANFHAYLTMKCFSLTNASFCDPLLSCPNSSEKKLSVHFSLVKLTCFGFNVRKHINQEKSYKREPVELPSFLHLFRILSVTFALFYSFFLD